MEAFSALLALCVGNTPVNGEFPLQRPVMRTLVFLWCVSIHAVKQTVEWSVIWVYMMFMWRHRNDWTIIVARNPSDATITSLTVQTVSLCNNPWSQFRWLQYNSSEFENSEYICNHTPHFSVCLVTHTCPNFSGGLFKPPMKLKYW